MRWRRTLALTPVLGLLWGTRTARGFEVGDTAWVQGAAAALAASPGAAKRLLGLPGAPAPSAPVWPEDLVPGAPGWETRLADALGVEDRQKDFSWLPPSESAWLLADLQAGDHGRAARRLEDLLLQQGGNLRLHLLTAWTYEEIGRPDLARDRYLKVRDAATTVDDTDMVRFALLRSQLRFRDGEGAREQIETYERLSDLAHQRDTPGAARRLAAARAWRGLFELALGHPRDAIRFFEEAIDLDPSALSHRANHALAHYLDAPRGPETRILSELTRALEDVASGGIGGTALSGVRDLASRMRDLARRSRARNGAPEEASAEAEVAAAKGDARASFFLAEVADRLEDYPTAARRYREAAPKLATEAQRAAARDGEARALLRAEEVAEATRTAKELNLEVAELLLDRPRYREAARILRRVLRRVEAGRLQEALDLLETAEGKWYEVTDFPLERGKVFVTLGRHREAELAFRRALKVDEARSDVHAWLALAILSRGEAGPGAGEALRHADRAKQLSPDALSLHARGWALSALGDARDGAEELARAIALSPKDPTLHYRHGLALLALDLEAAAVASFDQALALAPGAARAKLMRGIAMARLGRRDEALADLSEAAQNGRPDERKVARATLASLAEGVRARSPSQRPDAGSPAPWPPGPSAPLAASAAETASRIGPAWDRYRELAGEAAAGRLETVLRELERLSAAHPGFAEPLLARAVLELAAGDPDAAREPLHQLLDIRPDDARGHLGLAYASIRKDDPAPVVRAVTRLAASPAELPDDPFLAALSRRWDQVLDVDPFRPEALAGRGLVRLFRGRTAEAEADLEAAGGVPQALSGAALLRLWRYATGRDEAELTRARGLLQNAGARRVAARSDELRREVLRADERIVHAKVHPFDWDRNTMKAYLHVSPEMRAHILGNAVDAIDADRAGLTREPWNRVDGYLTAKKSPTVGPGPRRREGPGPLDYDVLVGAKPGPTAFPPPGPASRIPFDLPEGPILSVPTPRLTTPTPGPEDDGLDDLELENFSEAGGKAERPAPDLLAQAPSAGAAPGTGRAQGTPRIPDPVAAATPVPGRGRRPVPAAPTPDPGPPGGLASLEAALGPVLSGRPDLARGALEAVVAAHPDYEPAARDLALLYSDLGDDAAARRLVETGLRRFGEAPGWNRLAALLASRRRDARAAARFSRPGSEQGRAIESAYLGLAARAWERVRDRGGDETLSSYHLALLAYHRGALDEAKTHLAAARELPEAAPLAGRLAALEAPAPVQGG